MLLPILSSRIDAKQWLDVEKRGEDGWSGNAAIIANNPFHDLQCLEVFVLCVSWSAVKTRRVILPRWVILSEDVSEYTTQLIHTRLDTTVWIMLLFLVLGKKFTG